MNKLIIYGDIHGCYNEFISLRKKVNPKKDDIEVCVGDIITKGRDSIKVIDYVIKNNIKSVLGNHEDKIIRYLNHENSNKKNPIQLDEDEENIVSRLKNEHISFLNNMPLYLKFGDITAVHGGIQNNMILDDLSKRDKQKILRMRYLDKDENFLSLNKEDESSIFWADIYTGNQGFVVYGHNWSKKVKENKHAIGIDTGCVYGNKLTAVVFDDYNNSKEHVLYSQKAK